MNQITIITLTINLFSGSKIIIRSSDEKYIYERYAKIAKAMKEKKSCKFTDHYNNIFTLQAEHIIEMQIQSPI